MKHAKWIALGLTAAMAFGGATAVYAEETSDFSTEAVQQEMLQMRRPMGPPPAGEKPEGAPEEVDMSALELPEDFIPFDEAHVPDGTMAPSGGELKPIEFDADGKMLFGQKPDGQPPEMNGERPELPEGVTPGQAPEMNGERPELPEGVTPGQAPEMNGERPELPEGAMPGQGPMMNGGMQGTSGSQSTQA